MSGRDRCGLLLAAHGERGGGADNAGVERLAAELSGRGLAAEVGFGFIKGTPTIPEAVRAFTAPQLIVYPLFFSDGYFTSVRLPQLIADAGPHDSDRVITTLPPLGLDPALTSIVAAKASDTARASGYPDQSVAVVLLAHGSTKDAASRRATEQLVSRLHALRRFSTIACAFLDEPPALEEVIKRLPAPIVVAGLFAGEGLHGREDVPRLLADIGRSGVSFAGNVGAWPDIADIVALAVNDACCAAQAC